MNKLILLFVTGTVLFWGVFLSKLIRNVNLEPSKDAVENNVVKNLNFDDLLNYIKPQKLNLTDLRNPFLVPPAFSKKRGVKIAKLDVAGSESETAPVPAITLDAILDGDNPVAILKYKGESAVVSVGQAIWGVNILSIGENKVVLGYGGKKLELNQ